MLSTSEPSAGSPIGKVPYDILREIFIHCLPSPTIDIVKNWDDVQPDPTSAPILLCRICSSWRTIALTVATLWTHFRYTFHIIKGKDYDVKSASGKFKFVARQIEFIRWWRTNQGRIAPSLEFLDIYPLKGRDVKQKDAEDVTLDALDFLLESITSAQFLHIHQLFWHKIEARITAGHRVVFPNLHTLLVAHRCVVKDPFYTAVALLPNRAFPALRRLSIDRHGRSGAPLENSSIPNQWSMHTLTHLFLHASMSLEFWFACIHSAPNLQWGYFSINRVSGVGYASCRECTLPQLTTLHVGVYNRLPDFRTPLLSLLFKNLSLPALHTLSLASKDTMEHWKDHHVITELYGVLQSTPAITTLSLDDGFLSLRNESTPEILSALENVEPIWQHAPHLVNLRIRLHIQRSISYQLGWDGIDRVIARAVAIFVGNFFDDDGGWLDLQNPACPIQSLTIDDEELGDLMISSIQEHFEETPRFVIQASKKWALDLASDMRRGWGASI
ncbi:hypothetical protein BJ912DRAFT_1148494 [Pholiota molesta]|nr:hypothetical protein BJ912DRAFT_1148494 [Pholiota molesta]